MRPELLHLGPVSIKSYGFMLMLAFIASMLWCLRTAKRTGFTKDQVIDLSLVVLILSVVGARALFVLLNWHSYTSSPGEVLRVWEGGLSFHGGLLGGVLGGVWFAHRTKRSSWELADLVAPSLPLGYAITKWGCLLNGCCAGTLTDLPWAVRFPIEGSALHAVGPPSHPVQIYDSLLSLLIFAAINVLAPRLQVRGHLFLTYLGLYSVSRIGTEVLRKGVSAEVLFAGITEAQFASAIIIVLAAVVAAVLKRRWEARTTQDEPTGREGTRVALEKPKKRKKHR